MILDRMTEGSIGADAIPVSTADALPDDVLLRLELLQDALDGALGDPDAGRDVTNAGLGVFPDAEKDVGVVCQESPGSHGLRTLQGVPAKGIREPPEDVTERCVGNGSRPSLVPAKSLGPPGPAGPSPFRSLAEAPSCHSPCSERRLRAVGDPQGATDRHDSSRLANLTSRLRSRLTLLRTTSSR
jgi:hypothetical protein